jgi:hypothetical protein
LHTDEVFAAYGRKMESLQNGVMSADMKRRDNQKQNKDFSEESILFIRYPQDIAQCRQFKP